MREWLVINLKNGWHYIRLHTPCTCMAMQKRTWMTTFPFKEFLSLFNKSILGGMSLSNQYLLILDGHVAMLP